MREINSEIATSFIPDNWQHMVRKYAFSLFNLFSDKQYSHHLTVNENENNIKLHEPDQNVFPNPFTDEINLMINGDYHFQLISSSGKLIQAGNSNCQSMIIGHFLKGTYLLKITQGEKSKIFKLVKE